MPARHTPGERGSSYTLAPSRSSWLANGGPSSSAYDGVGPGGRMVISGGTCARPIVPSGCRRAPTENTASVTGLSMLCTLRPREVQPAPRATIVRVNTSGVWLL